MGGGSVVSSASGGKKKSSLKFWKKSKSGKSLVSIKESSEIVVTTGNSAVSNNERRPSHASAPVVASGTGTAPATRHHNGPASSNVNNNVNAKGMPQFVDITQTPWGEFEHGASIINFRHPAHAAAAAQKSQAHAAAGAATFKHANGTATHTINSNNNNKNAPQSDSHGTLNISNSMLANSDAISALPSPSPLHHHNQISSHSTHQQQSRTGAAGDHVSILTDPTGFYDNHDDDDDESSQATNRSTLSDFFGKFSFMSGSSGGTPSPSQRRTNPNKNKLNLLPPILDSVAGSESGSRNSHLAPRDIHNANCATVSGASPSNKGLKNTPSKASSLLLAESQKNQGNWLTRSRWFAKLTTWAFDQIDDDKSGQVCKKELYTGLLTIHLELAKYVGAAACRPMPRAQVYELFDKLDADHSETLCQEEFASVMVIMCSQLLSRVLTLFGSTLVLVPLLTRLTVDGSKYAWSLEGVQKWLQIAHHTWTTDVWPILIIVYEFTREHIQQVWDYTCTTVAPLVGVKDITPSTIPFGPNWPTTHATTFLEHFEQKWDTIVHAWNTHVVPHIPDNLSETLPYAITSCIFASLLVPWFLVQIDGFFENLANRKSAVVKKAKTPVRGGLKGT